MVKPFIHFFMITLALLTSFASLAGFIVNNEIEKKRNELAAKVGEWNAFSRSSSEHGSSGRWWYEKNSKSVKEEISGNLNTWAIELKKLAGKICGPSDGAVENENNHCEIGLKVNPKIGATFSMTPFLRQQNKSFELTELTLEISDIEIFSENRLTTNIFFNLPSGVKSFNEMKVIQYEVPEIRNPFKTDEILQNSIEKITSTIPNGSTLRDDILGCKISAQNGRNDEIPLHKMFLERSMNLGFIPSQFVYFKDDSCFPVNYCETECCMVKDLERRKFDDRMHELKYVTFHPQNLNGKIPVKLEENIPNGLYQMDDQGKLIAISENLEPIEDQEYVVNSGLAGALGNENMKYWGIEYNDSIYLNSDNKGMIEHYKSNYGENWPNIFKARDFVLNKNMNSINLGAFKIDKTFVSYFKTFDYPFFEDEQFSKNASERLKQIILSNWRNLQDKELQELVKNTFTNLENITFKDITFENGGEKETFERMVEELKELYRPLREVKIKVEVKK